MTDYIILHLVKYFKDSCVDFSICNGVSEFYKTILELA